MHLARRYLWASYDCMDYSGGVMLIHPALAEPQSVMQGKRRVGGLLMTPTGSARCTDILPEEIPLQQEMERAIAGALRDGQRAEDVATTLRLLCKQGAPLDALEDVLQTALIIYVSDAMRAALCPLDVFRAMVDARLTPRAGECAVPDDDDDDASAPWPVAAVAAVAVLGALLALVSVALVVVTVVVVTARRRGTAGDASKPLLAPVNGDT